MFLRPFDCPSSSRNGENELGSFSRAAIADNLANNVLQKDDWFCPSDLLRRTAVREKREEAQAIASIILLSHIA